MSRNVRSLRRKRYQSEVGTAAAITPLRWRVTSITQATGVTLCSITFEASECLIVASAWAAVYLWGTPAAGGTPVASNPTGPPSFVVTTAGMRADLTFAVEIDLTLSHSIGFPTPFHGIRSNIGEPPGPAEILLTPGFAGVQWAHILPSVNYQLINVGTAAETTVANAAGNVNVSGAFTVDASFALTRVQLFLTKTGAPAQNITARIFTDNGAGNPLAAIGTASPPVNASTFSTVGAYAQFAPTDRKSVV